MPLKECTLNHQRYLIRGTCWLVISLCLGAACSTAALAESRQHSGHEHGSAQLNVAVAEQTLLVEYITPAVNILGFERAAESDEENRALRKARALLASEKIINLPTDADCTLVHTELLHEAEHHGHGEEEHGARAHDESSHSEFQVEQEYRCSNIDALTSIDVNLFQHFPGNERIAAQIISPAGQKGVELTPSNARLILP